MVHHNISMLVSIVRSCKTVTFIKTFQINFFELGFVIMCCSIFKYNVCLSSLYFITKVIVLAMHFIPHWHPTYHTSVLTLSTQCIEIKFRILKNTAQKKKKIKIFIIKN